MSFRLKKSTKYGGAPPAGQLELHLLSLEKAAKLCVSLLH